MPVYEYDCASCGPFTARRSLAEYALPSTCPECGAEAPRALSSAQMARPQRSGPSRFAATTGHASGCRCCSPNIKIPRETWMKQLT